MLYLQLELGGPDQVVRKKQAGEQSTDRDQQAGMNHD